MFFHGSLSLYSTFFCYLLFVFLTVCRMFSYGSMLSDYVFPLCFKHWSCLPQGDCFLFAVRLQPVPASGEKLQKVLRYKPQWLNNCYILVLCLKLDGGWWRCVCVCFSSMFVSGFLRRLRWKWVAIKQHITLKLLLTSVLPGRFWLKWSMPIPPLKLRDLKREVGPKESSCQSQKCGFSLFGSPCPSLEGQAKRKWSQTHWLKNLRQRCLVFFLVES